MTRRDFILSTACGLGGLCGQGYSFSRGASMTPSNYAKDSGTSTLCGKKLAELRDDYRGMLFEEFIPWWYKYGIDGKYGGFITQMQPDGTLFTLDKNMWYQGRGLWTFAYLYNNFDKAQRHLDTASQTVDFIFKHGRDAQGDWIYMLTKDGKPLSDSTNIFSGVFVIYGLVEYFRATGDKKCLDVAAATTLRTIERIESPDFIGVDKSYPRGARVHGLWMIFVSVITELLKVYPDPEIEKAVRRYVDNILNRHYNPELKLTIEVLAHDFTRLSGELGNMVNVGHVAECVWMLKHEGERIGDKEVVERALKLLPSHIEAGWDKERGGISWTVDARTKQPINSVKAGWAHQEYMISMLEMFEHNGSSWAKDWYEKIHEYAFRTFPDKRYGQWQRVVNKEGELVPITPNLPYIANETRDVFHYPRYLMFNMQILDRLIKAGHSE